MNLAAVQHFAFDNFCYPLDEDTLEINILTGKDISKVFIVFGDPFAGGIMGGNWSWNGKEQEIAQKKELQEHFRWTFCVKPEFKRLAYYFRLVGKNNSENKIQEYFFTYNGFFTKEQFETAGKKYGFFIFPWMNSSDVCKVPKWAEDTVWYQIFPARFCRGKSDFTPKNLLPWQKFGEEIGEKKEFGEPVYGGNIQGIIDKLDYLKELGITGIYTTPINKSTSQHKYNTDDYSQIDEEFGTSEVVKTYVQEAHKRGIKVMFDGVFNHSGWFFDKWQDVWKNREKSQYKDWFMVNDFDFVEPAYGYKRGNAGNRKYYSFAFVDFMPKLNTNNPECRKYIIEICENWVKEYDIDAIRLDVANEVSHVFCKELKKAMVALKPDFYIIGEIWHNSLPWFRGDEFDSVMNYPLQNGIADFCSSSDWNVKQLEFAINRCYSMYYKQVNRVLFNQMDSHDTIRILNRCGGSKTAALQTLVLLFAMPGSACIYYGTEILLPGGYDPDNRRCMPWKEIEEGRFASEFDFVKKLIELRKIHPAMKSPEYEFVYSDSDRNGENRIVHIVKTAEDGSEKIGIILNCGSSGEDILKFTENKKVLLSAENILIFAI